MDSSNFYNSKHNEKASCDPSVHVVFVPENLNCEWVLTGRKKSLTHRASSLKTFPAYMICSKTVSQQACWSGAARQNQHTVCKCDSGWPGYSFCNLFLRSSTVAVNGALRVNVGELPPTGLLITKSTISKLIPGAVCADAM